VDQRSGSPPLKEARRKNMLVLLQRSARKEVAKSSGFIQNALFRPQKSKILLKTIWDVFKKYYCYFCHFRCAIDGFTSRWYHLSPGEHFCNECFEHFYRS